MLVSATSSICAPVGHYTNFVHCIVATVSAVSGISSGISLTIQLNRLLNQFLVLLRVHDAVDSFKNASKVRERSTLPVKSTRSN